MSNVNFKYENGDLLRDKVTGLEGVVMVRAEYATGCHHYGIQPRELDKGKTHDWAWLDQSTLECVTGLVVEFHKDEARTSGPCPSGPQL